MGAGPLGQIIGPEGAWECCTGLGEQPASRRLSGFRHTVKRDGFRRERSAWDPGQSTIAPASDARRAQSRPALQLNRAHNCCVFHRTTSPFRAPTETAPTTMTHEENRTFGIVFAPGPTFHFHSHHHTLLVRLLERSLCKFRHCSLLVEPPLLSRSFLNPRIAPP